MDAVVINQHGPAQIAQVRDIPDPVPQAGEVLVAVRSAALNHLDLWVAKGRPGLTLSFPHILGSDASGVILETGPKTHGVNVGDEVILNPGLSCGCCEYCRRGEQSECRTFGIVGMSRPGTFAEKVAVPAENIYPKPAHLNFDEAAALPLAYVTAWRMLMTRGRLISGETILIHGIGGGVALAALQLAKMIGATVFVTSSSDEKLKKARQLGANQGANYAATPDIAPWVRDQTGGRGVDLVVDTVGARTLPVDCDVLRRGGRIVMCGVTGGVDAQVNLQAIYWNQLTLIGSTMGSHEDFRQLLRAVIATGLKPVVDSVTPLEKGPEALARMERGSQFGKLVLRAS
jgi:NADPH:quinone reductase-like Zn-dependent oxidoreductase